MASSVKQSFDGCVCTPYRWEDWDSLKSPAPLDHQVVALTKKNVSPWVFRMSVDTSVSNRINWITFQTLKIGIQMKPKTKAKNLALQEVIILIRIYE